MFRSLQTPSRGTFKTRSSITGFAGSSLMTWGGGVSMQGTTIFQSPASCCCSRYMGSSCDRDSKMMPVKETNRSDRFVTLTRKWTSSLLTLSTRSTRTCTLEGWPERQVEDSVNIRRSELPRKICPKVLLLTRPLSVSLGCNSRKRSRLRSPNYLFDLLLAARFLED
jgi:hypothetical protein